jgi:CRP-like cAMP-binding protein
MACRLQSRQVEGALDREPDLDIDHIRTEPVVTTERRATGRPARGRNGELPSLGRGDFLGEIALIDGGTRTATVTAVEPIEALVIAKDGSRG